MKSKLRTNLEGKRREQDAENKALRGIVNSKSVDSKSVDSKTLRVKCGE
jgi:hypothetical protein